ncbi:MAG: hypothetical protein K0S01_164 [Herbinix sp.]|jgi:hypothetical protein|nr:hypothetical protein [Herbinix sp.]
MKTRNINAIEIIGFILILLTILLFGILPGQRTSLDWISICFVLAAEIEFILGFLFVQREAGHLEGTMLYSGAISIIALYSAISILVSILFMLVFREETRYLVAIQIILMSITAILLVLIYISSAHLAEKNNSSMQAVSGMQELLNKVTVLQSATSNSPYSSQLNALYEAIRYSDYSTIVPTDESVAGKITELELVLGSALEDKDGSIRNLVDSILVLMKQRAAEAASQKVGGI